MPRTVASSRPFAAISPAASFAVRRARSSRIKLESKVVLPVMNGREPARMRDAQFDPRAGCVVEVQKGRTAADGR